MYNSLELIQSKQTFQMQYYAHLVLQKSAHLNDPTVKELRKCCLVLTSEMIDYHELEKVKEQIKKLERYSLHVAKFGTLLPCLPNDIQVFPPLDQMSEGALKFYYELYHELLRKQRFDSDLNDLN